MTTCFLSPAAEQDLDEIVTYIASKNPLVARAFLDSLFAAMEKLASHPEMGHFRNDLTS